MSEVGVAAPARRRIVQICGRRGTSVGPREETCGIGEKDQARRRFHGLNAAGPEVRGRRGWVFEGKLVVHAITGVTRGPGKVGVESGFRSRALEDATLRRAGIRHKTREDARSAMIGGRFPARKRGIPGWTEIPAARIDLKEMHQGDFADVSEAERQTGAVARRRQRGQDQSGQNRQDRDHDQEFDQGEPAGRRAGMHL